MLLTAAAYVLMQELRLRAARTACARVQVSGLRERLLKLGVQVVVSGLIDVNYFCRLPTIILAGPELAEDAPIPNGQLV